MKILICSSTPLIYSSNPVVRTKGTRVSSKLKLPATLASLAPIFIIWDSVILKSVITLVSVLKIIMCFYQSPFIRAHTSVLRNSQQ